MPSRSALEVFIQRRTPLTLAEWLEITEHRASQIRTLMNDFGVARLDSIKPLYGASSHRTLASIFWKDKPELIFGMRGVFDFEATYVRIEEGETRVRHGWGLTRESWVSISVEVGRDRLSGEYVKGLSGVQVDRTSLAAIVGENLGKTAMIFSQLGMQVRDWDRIYREKLDKLSRIREEFHADDRALIIYDES